MAPKTRCLTHDLWAGLGQQIYQYLALVTLEDVATRTLHKKFPHDPAAMAKMGAVSAIQL